MQFTLKFLLLVEQKRDKGMNEQAQRGPKCLVIDDSDLQKRGQYIEGVGKIWSHVLDKHILGFKINMLVYWDSISTLPIDFVLHREKGKKGKMKRKSMV
jgi:hypothetical protein